MLITVFLPGFRAWSACLSSSCVGRVVCTDATCRLLITSHETLPKRCSQDNSQISQGKYYSQLSRSGHLLCKAGMAYAILMFSLAKCVSRENFA